MFCIRVFCLFPDILKDHLLPWFSDRVWERRGLAPKYLRAAAILTRRWVA